MKKINTLKKNYEFSNVIKRGNYHVKKQIIVYITKNNENKNIIGIAISTKLCNAVNRNKIKRIIRAEDIEENLYAAIDVVYDKLNKQLRKYKKRLQDRHQSNESIRFDAIEDIEENDYSSNEDNLDIVIKRTKKFGVKPMSPEEAVLQMDLSEHDFYMFRNSESNGISIVYRRKNGGYGLIESE